MGFSTGAKKEGAPPSGVNKELKPPQFYSQFRDLAPAKATRRTHTVSLRTFLSVRYANGINFGPCAAHFMGQNPSKTALFASLGPSH